MTAQRWVAWLGCALWAGCGSDCPDSALKDPIFGAPPVSREVIERVLAEPERIPQREPESGGTTESALAGNILGGLGERLGMALEQAATTPQPERAESEVTVVLMTADWCRYCRPAKADVIPWLRSQGYVVEVLDVTREFDSRRGLAAPRSLPTWVFLRNGRELWRQEGGHTPQHLESAVRRLRTPASPTVGGFFGPTIRVADALPLVAGVTLKLGSAATISIPQDLKWTVAQKPGLVVVSFAPSPQVTVHKVLNWRVRLEGVEISPTAVTLQIDNLPDVTVKIDWRGPTAARGPAIDASADRHSAAASGGTHRRPLVRFVGRTVLFAYRVCAIASFVLMVV